jgi:formamidopyrimidine-DNA glycosylase
LPELPEVQTIIDALKTEDVEGKCIRRARVYWPAIIATSKPQGFCRRIKNKRIKTIGRRGKFIVSQLSEGLFLIVHLRMTGRFDIGAHTAQRMPHVHVVLELDDGRDLLYHDTRKFGRFYLTANPDTVTGGLGAEPLDAHFTAGEMVQMLKQRRRQIKPLLLDQGFLAGLGNIYVDEALWDAAIHPQRSAHSLTTSEAENLYRSIRIVLRRAIANAGTSLGHGLGNYAGPNRKRGRNSAALKVFRRSGEACLRCGYPIERIVVGQRGTHICRRCQRS